MQLVTVSKVCTQSGRASNSARREVGFQAYTRNCPSELHKSYYECEVHASKFLVLQSKFKCLLSIICCPSDSSPANFLFNGLELHFSHLAKHQGHIISFNLSDPDGIVRVKRDLVHKANCMLYSFPSATPWLKLGFLPVLPSSYGLALWFSSFLELRSLEITLTISYEGFGLFLICTVKAYFIVLLKQTARTILSFEDPPSSHPQPRSLNQC